MPAVRCLVADGNHDARWLAGFEYDDDCVRLRTFEVGVNELVTTALRGIHHRDLYVFRPAFQPLLEMVSDSASVCYPGDVRRMRSWAAPCRSKSSRIAAAVGSRFRQPVCRDIKGEALG